MSTCLGLFYTKRFGNRIHCRLIFIFFVKFFLKRFFLQMVLLKEIIFQQIYLTDRWDPNRYYHWVRVNLGVIVMKYWLIKWFNDISTLIRLDLLKEWDCRSKLESKQSKNLNILMHKVTILKEMVSKFKSNMRRLSIFLIGLFLWHINHCKLFNAKSSLYIYIKYIWFGLVGFYGISTIAGYLMPNPLYIYIY